MVLTSYYKAIVMMLGGVAIETPSASGSTSTSILSVSSAHNIMKFYSALNSVTTSKATSGVCIGSGTTPPTIGDYQMESQITTVTGTSSYKTTISDDGAEVVVNLTVTNTGDSDITIGEVGVQINVYGNWAWLVERTVLDSPVTIPAGGIGQVTYTIRFHYPAA